MNIFKRKKNVIVVGADGMLGYDVVKYLKHLSYKQNSCIGAVLPLDHDQFDIASGNLYKWMRTDVANPPVKFDYVVNCIAATDTGKIENDAEYRQKAYCINAMGVKSLALACKLAKAKLIHISTDWVYSEHSSCRMKNFDIPTYGNIISAYHLNNATEFPTSIYGMQKLIGERFAQEMLGKKCTILRTSWLYGSHRKKSFVHKILLNFMKSRIAAEKEGKEFEFNVTSNEYSIPTSTTELARMIVNVIKHDLNGILNACGTSDSENYFAISRFQFAFTAFSIFGKRTCIDEFNFIPECIKPVERSTYAPKYSRLYNWKRQSFLYQKLYDGFNEYLNDWESELKNFIEDNFDELESWLLDEKAKAISEK